MLLLLQRVSARKPRDLTWTQTYGNGLSQLGGGLESEAAGLLEDAGSRASLDGGGLGTQSGGEDTAREHVGDSGQWELAIPNEKQFSTA